EVFMVHEPDLEDWWGFDYETGDAVVTEVLEDLKKEGIIGAIGLGGWNCRKHTQLIKTGRFDVVLAAGGLRLTGPSDGFPEMLEACKQHDVGVIVGSVFGGGFFHELITIDRSIPERLLQSENFLERLHGYRVSKLYDLADELQC